MDAADLVTTDIALLIEAGDRCREMGDPAAALNCYDRACAQAPEDPRTYFKRATALGRLGRASDAEAAYREALRYKPDYAEANGNLGVLLFERGEWDEAETCYRRALVDSPDYFEAHVNLARTLLAASRAMESLYFARRAAQLNPSSGLAAMREGLALVKLGRVRTAIERLRHAVVLDPELAAAWLELGSMLQKLDRDAEADAILLKACELSGDDPNPWNNRAFWTNYRVLPRDVVWARHREFGAWLRGRVGPIDNVVPTNCRPDPDRRLRIGFISPDFRRHSVGQFVEGAVSRLDHQTFQLVGYHDYRSDDHVTDRLKPAFHRWRKVAYLPTDKLLKMIRDDRIDILIDLAGLTGGNRMRLFARRAAPIQVSYLGYPNTTGLDTMDYRLVDAITDPIGDGDEFHSERLWRLPGSFLCYTPPQEPVPVEPPPMLKNGYPTFGSFNNRVKISEQCLDLWAALLVAIPTARLILKSIQGTEDDESRKSLLDRFIARGIDAARVEVHGYLPGIESHLTMYAQVDVALDTFPYNGTTTTCEALWMGVPVLTLRGDRHAARVGESILANVGLRELVARDTSEYLDIASRLTADPQSLAAMRESMRDQLVGSTLLDRASFGANLGQALRAMWSSHCERFPAELPVEVAMEAAGEDLIRLCIGATERPEGWKLLTEVSDFEPDYVGGLESLDQFPDACCAEVYAPEILQRLKPHDILDVLNEIHRILIDGGSFHLSVPNFDELTRRFQMAGSTAADKFLVMRQIFGMQDHEWDRNLIGLNRELLEDYLADVGFSSIEEVESFGLLAAEDARGTADASILRLTVTK